MNLMIVLVPVLLLSLVFTQTAVIEIELPGLPSSGEIDPDAVHLEVVIRDAALEVRDGRGGLIKRLPHVGGQPDTSALGEVLRAVKARMPDKRDITLLLEDDTSYQVMVNVMDTVRAYPAVVAGSVVNAALFPSISLGDADPLEGSAS